MLLQVKSHVKKQDKDLKEQYILFLIHFTV